MKDYLIERRRFFQKHFELVEKRRPKVSDALPAICGQRSNTTVSLKFYCWAIFGGVMGKGLIPKLHMSHFAYACKMRYPLNLVLENSEYLWFY